MVGRRIEGLICQKDLFSRKWRKTNLKWLQPTTYRMPPNGSAIRVEPSDKILVEKSIMLPHSVLLKMEGKTGNYEFRLENRFFPRKIRTECQKMM